MNTQTDYEKNCAVAEKLGYNPDHDHRNYPQVNGAVSNAVMWYEGKSYHSADYCNDPRDYMLIAIEYCITAYIDANDHDVGAYHLDTESAEYPKNRVGEAIVDVFLAMDITTNES